MNATRALIRCDDADLPSSLSAHRWTYQKEIRSRAAASELTLRVTSLGDIGLSNVRDHAADLVKIAAYVYASDQVVARGGPADVYGDHWHRHLELCLPVSDPSFWQETDVHDALADALGFLTGDDWVFHFSEAPPEHRQIPLDVEAETVLQHPNSVVLFSGGADSLCSTIELLTDGSSQPVLVSHRSTPPIDARQQTLTRELRRRFPDRALPHLSFWIHRRGSDPSDPNQRSRGFLFASLGAAVAEQIGVGRVLLGDNGFVSINPPISGQIVGTLASRATHPGFLARFNQLCSLVLPSVTVSNPLWSRTRAEVFDVLPKHDCADLLRDTVSCSRPRGLPAQTPQCGYCSQCVDRRIGVIAAGLEQHDPAERYAFDIFVNALREGEARTISESLVHFARRVDPLSLESLFSELPELAECVLADDPDFEWTAVALASVIQRQARTVLRVVDRMIQIHSSSLALGTLPENCLLRLVAGGQAVPRREEVTGNVFAREGRLWTVAFAGYRTHVDDSLGMSYLARLLAHPGREFHVADLAQRIGSLDAPTDSRSTAMDQRALAEGLRLDRGSTQGLLDARARAEYRSRIEQLEAERVEAEAAGDPERVVVLDDELMVLRQQLQAAASLGGRVRSFAGPEEKIRQRVTKAIRRARRQILTFHPALGRHLASALTVGLSSSYRPEPTVQWAVAINPAT